MVLLKRILFAALMLTCVDSFARGYDAAEYWMRPRKKRTPSVLERSYRPDPAPMPVAEPVRSVTNVVEREVERIVAVPVTNVVEREVERIVAVPVTNVVERVVTNIVDRPVEVKVEVERVVTNVVEKVVFDRTEEYRLAKDNTELEHRRTMLETRNEGLSRRNDELQRELDAERGRRERLEQALKPSKAKTSAAGRKSAPARITAKTTYYDRKRSVAYFDGDVHVDDADYQLHADKAYVFASGTNDVRRIVAVGHVAMTNELRRAYGCKASYYRQDGMVVLYGGDGVNAEIRDESKAEDQTVRGSKIKFWIDNQQVEVIDATITAPVDGAGGISSLQEK